MGTEDFNLENWGCEVLEYLENGDVRLRYTNLSDKDRVSYFAWPLSEYEFDKDYARRYIERDWVGYKPYTGKGK